MSANIGIYINAYDNASKTIANTGKAVDTLGGETQKTGKQIENTSKKFKGFNDTLKVTAGIVLRDLINKFSDALTESMSLGAQIGTLQASFNALTEEAGATDLSIEKLREATKGTVSDVDLLTAANNALALGLPVEDLDDLFKAAMDVGHAMGQTTLKSVNDLTTALGRGSARILDNLGILVNTNTAYENYAVILGKTSEELTEAERKTAFQTAAMATLNDKAGILEGTTSESQLAQERWNASITNAKTSVGGFLGPLGQIAPMLSGVMPLISTMAVKLLPQLITQDKLAAVAKHLLGVATAAWATITNLSLQSVKMAFMSNPIGIAIMAIVTAITLLYAAWENNWLGIRDTFKAISDWIMSKIGWLIDGLKAIAGFFANLFGLGGEADKAVEKMEKFPAPTYAEEEEGSPLIPVITAQKGLDALIKRPTLILAGEREPERLSITPSDRTGAAYVHRRPNRVQFVFNAPVVNVEGVADVGVAEEAAVYIQQVLQNVIVEATSPSAPTEQKRIRLSTSMLSPTTIKPSTTRTGGRPLGRTTFPI